MSLGYNKLAYEFNDVRFRISGLRYAGEQSRESARPGRCRPEKRGKTPANALHPRRMPASKPPFPAPDHDHDRCAADAIAHAEQVCRGRAQKFTPIRRQVL